MSLTLAPFCFCFTKANIEKRNLITTIHLSEDHNWEVATHPATLLEWENCSKHLAEASTALREVSSFGDSSERSFFLWGLPTNDRYSDWLCRTFFLLSVRTVRLYRHKPVSIWDAKGDVPHNVSHPLSHYGGRCWRLTWICSPPPPLQIFFQNAHEMCSLAMFSSDDSKQCVQNWSNMLYDVIRSMGLKSLIKVHYFKTDLIESGVGQSMFQWSWWKISTTFIYIHKDQITQKTAIWVEASLWWMEQRSPGFFVCWFVLFCFSFFPSEIPQTRQWERYPNRVQHLPAETFPSLLENLEMSGTANRRCWHRDKALGWKKRRKEPTEIAISDMFTQMARLPVTKLCVISL